MSARALLIKRRRQVEALHRSIDRAKSEGDRERLARLLLVIGPMEAACDEAQDAVREENDREQPGREPAGRPRPEVTRG